MTLPLEIRVPGSFVVLQGVPGDGLPNTIDLLPEFIDDDIRHDEVEGIESTTVSDTAVAGAAALRRREERFHASTARDQQSTNATTTSTVPLNVIGSSMQGLWVGRPGLGKTPVNAALSPSHCVETVPQPLDDSFIVVQSGDDTQGVVTTTTLAKPPPGAAISPNPSTIDARHATSITTEVVGSRKTPRWNQTSSPQQLKTRTGMPGSDHDSDHSMNQYSQRQLDALRKWRVECRRRQEEQYHEWQEVCQANHRLIPGGSVSAEDRWWLSSDGQLAVLETLPVPGVQPRIMGSLAPGETVVATACYTIRSDDFTPVTRIIPNDRARMYSVYPPGREGWLQILKIDRPRSKSAYVVLSRDGYSYLGTGVPSHFVDPLRWIWRVTCIDGAYVREGLDLSTNHIATIPYGSLVQVLMKTVNAMGLSRLQVCAIVPRNPDDASYNPQYVEGWCSEFLNPLSGQRGSIIQPLPFPVPALYRVALSNCAIIRSGIELSSPEIGYAPTGAVVAVTGRVYSEHPTDRCVDRLRLAGNGGWISLRLNKHPPEDLLVVDHVGIDTSFDPKSPGKFHLGSMRKIRQQQNNRPASLISPPTISSVEDEEVSSAFSSSSSSSSSVSSGSLSGETPTCMYTRSPDLPRAPLDNESKKSPDQPAQASCLICLSEDRTATLVHGGTGHIACCLQCARILKARGDPCPVCRLPIDLVIQHFFA